MNNLELKTNVSSCSPVFTPNNSQNTSTDARVDNVKDQIIKPEMEKLTFEEFQKQYGLSFEYFSKIIKGESPDGTFPLEKTEELYIRMIQHQYEEYLTPKHRYSDPALILDPSDFD